MVFTNQYLLTTPRIKISLNYVNVLLVSVDKINFSTMGLQSNHVESTNFIFNLKITGWVQLCIIDHNRKHLESCCFGSKHLSYTEDVFYAWQVHEYRLLER